MHWIISRLYIKFLKKNELESISLRNFFKNKYKIDIGLYSYGCFDPLRIPPGTKIGRYCSFSPTCYFFSRNHGIGYLSSHPYLYNSKLGVVKHDTIEFASCNIEDDVWIGHNVIILPSVTFIGRGAVIGAGSVVTKDVPAYAIVAGNPAKIVRSRFNRETIEEIESTSWWMYDKYELTKILNADKDFFYSPEGTHEEKN